MTFAEVREDPPITRRVILTTLGLGLILAFPALILIKSGGILAILVLAAVALVILVLSVRYPGFALWGLAVMTAANVDNNFTQTFHMPLTTELVVAGTALILFLRWAIYRKGFMFSGRAAFFFTCYWFSMLISSCFARDVPTALDTTFANLKIFILVFLIVAFIDGCAALRVYVGSILSVMVPICVIGTLLYMTNHIDMRFGGFVNIRPQNGRFTGPLPDPNFFGALLASLMPQVAGWALFSQANRTRVLSAVTAVILGIGMYYSGSRGALIAAAVAMAPLLLMVGARARVLLIVATACGAIIASVALRDTIDEQFRFLGQEERSASTDDLSVVGRLASWAVAKQLFLEHPIFGAGPGNLKSSYQDTALNLGLFFRGEGRSTHSFYFEAAAEEGIVGLTFQLACIVAAFLGLRTASRLYTLADRSDDAMTIKLFTLGLLAYLVAMVFLHSAYPQVVFTYIVIGISAPAIARRDISIRARAWKPSRSPGSVIPSQPRR